jgi:two-component system, chemotaxis family, sensor kinase CheA
MDDLLNDFLSETADHIDGIGSYLVLFEKNPSDADAVTQIFRLVHTLKGTSGFLGLNRLQAIAHAAETLIDTLRDGAPPTALAVSLLLQAFDRIKDLLAKVGEVGEEPAGDDSEIVGQIEAYLHPEPAAEPADAAKAEAQTPKEAPEPAAPPPEIAKSPEAPQPSDIAAGAPMEVKAEANAAARPAQPEIARSAPRDIKASVTPAAKEAEQAPSREKAPDTIRIAVAAIQRIMDLVSELVLTRNQIMDLSRQHQISQIKSPLERLSTVTSDLQDAVMRARMQPMTRLFASVPRLVRELSVECKKKIDLVIEGGDTELDRQLIEAIRDPMTHLIRNCADHGIEPPADRIAAGKPEAGQITIAAFYESGQVHIEIGDDGRGLNADRIREKAVERGLGDVAAIAGMSDEEVYRFILEAGFSTAAAVTTVSGRGVGMDVVRANLEAIGGTIALQSSKGRGSKFILKIPLTLAIAPALIVRVGAQRFAVPQQYVVEAVNLDEDAGNLKTMDNALLLQLREELIPVVELSTVLDVPSGGKLEDKLVVVLGLRGNKIGVIVDEIDDIQEIVVKPLGALFSGLKVFSGNTILGDGSVILIVDPAGVAAVANLEKTSGVLPMPDRLDAGASTSSLILFKAGEGAPKVLPQAAVSRILRARPKDFEQASGHFLYRYQNRLIPVLPVGGASPNSDSCLILILSLYDRTFGLCIDSVLDIVESIAEIQLVSGEPSLLGAADLGGVAVEFVDAGHFYRMAFQDADRSAEDAKTDVLIVDCEPGAQGMLTPILASAGHRAIAVETVEQANKLLKQKSFGVILMDAKSARGIEESALARQADALLLIFDEDRQSGAERGGGEGVLRKFDRSRILKTIAHHLESSPRDKHNATPTIGSPQRNASLG